MDGRPTLEGRTALVTGAGGGVGAAVAMSLAAQGAKIVSADLSASSAHATADAVVAAGGYAVAVGVDVSTEEGCNQMLATAIEAFGGLHILHNNAALTDPRVVVQDTAVGDLQPEVFERIMAVNVRGPYLGTRAAIPHLVAAGGGTIINTSSVYSLLGDAGLAGYSMSKGAVNALTRHVATAYGPKGIRCNAVVLGVVRTPMMDRAKGTPTVQAYLDGTVVGRMVEPAEVGAAVAFLCSDGASSITGQIIPIDGGQTAHVPWWRAATDG
jgi:NAD(P)-dependent dehydrogenase (short-subunit alcohol dehydrogenase family)